MKRTVRGRPRWYVRITSGPRQIWKSLHTSVKPPASVVAKVEAEMWAAYGGIRRGPPAKRSGPAAEAVRVFLDWASLNRSASYHSLLKRSLEGLLEVAPPRLDAWTAPMIEAWLRSGRLGEYGRAWSARTQNMNRQHAARFLRWAQARELGADAGIISRVERAAEKRPLPRWHSLEEVAAILAACDAWDAARGPQWPPPGGVGLAGAVRIALGTGARLGEIQALRWEDVDLRRRAVTIRPGKTGRGRGVPLAPIAAEALDLVPRIQRHGPVVPWLRSKTDRRLRRALVAAHLRPCGWHSFRHTFASHLAMGGAQERQIQELLGHSSIAMAARYSHLIPGSLDVLLSKLEYKTPVAPSCSTLS